MLKMMVRQEMSLQLSGPHSLSTACRPAEWSVCFPHHYWPL